MSGAQHGPSCPFCRAPWTEAMLDQYDRMSVASDCACCAGPHVEHEHEARPAAEMPVSDLCCEACGRAIYQAMAG